MTGCYQRRLSILLEFLLRRLLLAESISPARRF